MNLAAQDIPDPFAECLFLAGPTGCGKSSVALALASGMERAAIVNADAFQLYRGYEILSAAPVPEDRDRVPHHLYGVISLDETCDAVRYREMAQSRIEELVGIGVRPIVVGGSGLYLKALTHGLAPTPPGQPDLRRQLEALSLEDLVAWYAEIDPPGAASTNLRNRRYVTRNLEICLLSGRRASALKESFANPAPRISGVVLSRDRSDLHARINRRTIEMFETGVAAEVARFERSSLSSTAGKAIGLAEIRDLLAGKIDQATAIQLIQQSTRRYAKRQETWFRREKAFQSVCLSPGETADSAARRIIELFPNLKLPPPAIS